MRNKYYSLVSRDKKAVLSIYGDITSFPCGESDVSAYNLTKELEVLDAEEISVYINSYGGEVAEGLAIYNALKRHKAKIITYIDGFACSIASVIAMAGDERKMYKSSLLMIHNCWTTTIGNANELRKTADDLDIMMNASISAYMSAVNISENELKEMLDSESWILADEALEKGFVTEIVGDEQSDNHSQSARQAVFEKLTANQNSIDVNGRVNELTEKVDKLLQLAEAPKPQAPEPQEPEPPKPTENVELSAFEKFIKTI